MELVIRNGASYPSVSSVLVHYNHRDGVHSVASGSKMELVDPSSKVSRRKWRCQKCRRHKEIVPWKYLRKSSKDDFTIFVNFSQVSNSLRQINASFGMRETDEKLLKKPKLENIENSAGLSYKSQVHKS